MKFHRVHVFAVVATFALVVVNQSAASDLLNGLDLLQNYYGALAPYTVSAPLPALPVPALPPTVPYAPLPKVDCGSGCSCEPHHLNCLSMLKPCLHAKLLQLKRKLIEKKLALLLAHCAHYNNDLYKC